MKITVIGAGSFVFGPTVLKDAIIKNRLDDCELALVDINKELVDLMASVGKRIARENNVSIKITSTTRREEALEGADFVISSAAIQGIKRWLMDYEVLKKYGFNDQARECGGLGGLVNTFRAVTLAMDIAKDMEKYCPHALFLDVANPMPRVVTAVNEYTKIKAYGFCNIAWSAPDGYEWLASLINRNKEDLDVVTAGLNHFAWLVSIKEKNTGKDLYDEVINAIESKEGREFNVMRKWLKEYGLVPMGSVDHHGEYLPYDSDIEYATKPPYHGDERERAETLNNLKDVAEGKVPYDVAFKMLSWEHPVDLAVDIFKKRNKHHDMINLPNKGFIEGIPDGRIVEVPVDVIDGDVIGQKIPPLPQRLTQTLNIISDVHELSAKAAVFGDIKLAEEVIELDFAIPDKEKAKKALHDMIRNHIDILPQFV